MGGKGIALILSLLVVVTLVVLGTTIFSRSASESSHARRYLDSTRAFWLAEAGLNRALEELREDFNLSGTNLWSGYLGEGRYSVDVEDVIIDTQTAKRVTAHGFIPADNVRVERVIQAIMCKYIPPYFYDNAIYSAADVDLNGNAFSITGDVRYADSLDTNHPENINGTITYDPSISPLARLDFEQLLLISETQGNVYDEARLQDVNTGKDSFPTSFWYSEPTDPSDPTTGTPNIVYVQGDLQLNGNIGTIGGFFLVVGDVITNPDDTSDATINGNGEIEGVIYTRGEFDINGGGGNLNINGGVWAGEEAELNGNAHVAYNQDYMSAIEALNINPDVQVVSWEELQNPYRLTP
jgi:hypothetical protein